MRSEERMVRGDELLNGDTKTAHTLAKQVDMQTHLGTARSPGGASWPVETEVLQSAKY